MSTTATARRKSSTTTRRWPSSRSTATRSIPAPAPPTRPGPGSGARPHEERPPARSELRGQDYLAAFRASLGSMADKVRPELILLSAGFDAHAEDPVGNLGLEVEDFVEMTRDVLEVAETHAGGRLVSVLEGGLQRPDPGGLRREPILQALRRRDVLIAQPTLGSKGRSRCQVRQPGRRVPPVAADRDRDRAGDCRRRNPRQAGRAVEPDRHRDPRS